MLKYNDTMCLERVAETFTQSYKEKKQTKKVSGVKLLKNMTLLQFGVGSLK